MKILLLCEWLLKIGGCEIFTYNIYKSLKQSNIFVKVLCIDNKIHDFFHKELKKDLILIKNNLCISELNNLIAKYKFNLIHAIPYEKSIFKLSCYKLKIPIIATEPSDGSIICDWWYSGSYLKNIINNFKDIHVFSPHTSANLKKDYNYKNKIHIIPPIRLKNSSVKWKKKIINYNIVYFGRISPEKGIDSLIFSINELSSYFPKLNIDIWGYYENKTNWPNKLVSSMGLNDKINFMGNYDSIKNINICKYDLYLFPSNFEGFPYSLIEAIETGIPCISTKRNGLYFQLKNYNEFIFTNNKISSFTNAIKLFYKNYDYYFSTNNIRKEILQKKIDYDNVNQMYINMYKGLLNR